MKRIVLAAAVVLALAGCSAPAPAESPSPISTPTPTESKLPAVSLQTTCMFLYGSNVDGPLATTADIITRFVAAPDASTITTEELETNIASIETARDHAQTSIQPFTDAQLAPLKSLLEAKTGGENRTISFDDYKASGIELLTQCTPYL